MKRFLLIFFLTFSFEILVKADDIRDFEIEGLSLGDSALEIQNKDAIEEQKKLPDAFYPKSKRFFTVSFGKSKLNLETYEALQLELKSNDSKYIIYSIMGKIYFPNNIEGCYKKQNDIAKDLAKLFKNVQIDHKGISNHGWDKSGKSTRKRIIFWFDGTEDYVKLVCNDWSDELNQRDNLGVTINSGEFANFLRNEAY